MENEEVEQMSATHVEIRNEMEFIGKAMESLAIAQSIKPSETVKPFVMAVIDYSERMKRSEVPAFAPQLNKSARLIDYAKWLHRSDMVSPVDFENLYTKIIGYTPEAIIAIV